MKSVLMSLVMLVAMFGCSSKKKGPQAEIVYEEMVIRASPPRPKKPHRVPKRVAAK